VASLFPNVQSIGLAYTLTQIRSFLNWLWQR